MKKNILISCLFVFSYVFIMAQEKPLSNDLDKEYTPPQTSIFNNKNSDNITSNYNDVSQNKNIITIGLINFMRGYYDINYERAFNSRLSLSASFGKFFMRDIIYNDIGEFFEVINDYDDDEIREKEIISNSDIINKNSYQYSLAFKFYFDKDYYNSRQFIEFRTRIMKINYKWSNSSDFYNSNALIGLPTTYFDSKIFTFNYGYQWNTGSNKIKLCQEFLVGIGLKNNNYYGYTLKPIDKSYGYDLNSSTNNSGEFYYKNKINETRLTITCGYKLGIGW